MPQPSQPTQPTQPQPISLLDSDFAPNLPKGTIRTALFDVDGTLLSFRTHSMPASTRHALIALRAAGIKPVLATGRPPFQLKGIDLSLFSAVLTFNGQLCFIPSDSATSENPLEGATYVVREPMPAEVVQAAVALADKDEWAWLFMEERRCYLTERTDRVRELEAQVDGNYPVGPAAQALGREIYQLNVFAPSSYDAVVDSELKAVKSTRWTEIFSDVMPATGGKAPGAARLLKALGHSLNDTVAFGDGGNDADMLAAARVGVAMGNAGPEARAAANYVTADVDSDGIYRACVALGLIEDTFRR